MMLSPRTRFKGVPSSKTWPDVVDSHLFQEAVSAALLTMQINNAAAPADQVTAAALHQRSEGAKQFLNILMSLTDTETTERKPFASNLNHKV